MELGRRTRSLAAVENLGLRRRLDALLVFGHGLPHEECILDMIEAAGFVPEWCKRRQIRNIRRFIRTVYANDYAPFHHLRDKTRYLVSVPREVLLILVRNPNPRNEVVGEGEYRHLESAAMRELKWTIREAFNPRIAGEMTHDHVIHGTDCESQAADLVERFGETHAYRGIREDKLTWPRVRPHVGPVTELSTSWVGPEDIVCNQLTGSRWSAEVTEVALRNTVQFKSIVEPSGLYRAYVSEHRGVGLRDYHSEHRFKQLQHTYSFESALEQGTVPLARIVDGADGLPRYLIVDGVHRAAVLAAQADTKIPLVVLEGN